MIDLASYPRPDPHRLYGVTHNTDGSPILGRVTRTPGGFEVMFANATCDTCFELFTKPWSALARAYEKQSHIFCSISCCGVEKRKKVGPDNSTWKGGRTLSSTGYWMIRRPGHPRAQRGYVPEHILVAEAAAGRPLPRTVHVHHVNEIRSDNNNTNLVICQNAAYHRLLHARARVVAAGGHPDKHRVCSACRQLKLKHEFGPAPNQWDGRRNDCNPCRAIGQIRRNAKTL